MIRNIQRPWFEVWGTEVAQNRILKSLLGFTLVLCAIETVAVSVLATRPPILIAVADTETRYLKSSAPPERVLEAEAERVTRTYIAKRHNWEWQTVEESFKDAGKLVEPSFQKKFTLAIANQLKLARGKKVSQRFHITAFSINPKAKTIRVSGDRILIVEGIRAASPLSLTLSYDYGPRAKTNPEGVYITSDELVSEPLGPELPGGGK